MTRLGEIAIAGGDAQGAVDLLAPLVEAERESGIPYFVAASALVLASGQRRVGDLAGATATLDDVASMVDGFGNDWMMARLQLQQALIALEVGDLEATKRLAHTSLEAFVRMGQRPDVAPVLDALGFLAIAAQNEARAVHCFATADALRAKLEIVAWPPDAASVGDACDGLRAVLGEEAFTRHWDEGAALSLDEAVDYVSRSPRT